MGFSFRIAKGLRIRVSSRGVRTSVGPRVARLHFGSGAPGVSTGYGRVGFYKSLRAGRGGGGRRSSAGISSSQSRKALEASQLHAALDGIQNAHRGEFRPAQPPVAPPLPPVDESEIRARHQARALAGIGFFKRAERRAAKERAASAADEEIAAHLERAVDERTVLQAQLDDRWSRLLANDPEVVRETLEEAFEDNEAPAAAVGVERDEVDVVVLVPGIEAVPERIPSTTLAGNLTLRKLSKSDRSSLYTELACGHLLATVREVFAVVPNISSVRSAVLRYSVADSYGHRDIDCLVAATFFRKAFEGVLWDSVDSLQIVADTAREQLVKPKGRAKELQPLDLSREPELAALVEHVDLTELSADMSPDVRRDLPGATTRYD